MPSLVTDRALERTSVQDGHYSPRSDFQSDVAMVYSIGENFAERLKKWTDAGFVPHCMTGVAWGQYQDYLYGKFDGRTHWDEGQVNGAGSRIMHAEDVPYMVPTAAFAKYLESKLQPVIDAGVEAIHLEEPEFWAGCGFSEAFKREWQIYYNEPWQRPDSSCDAQYRASKLKYYLYRRTLDQLCSSLKEYSLVKHNRPIRFYVATHSLINYTQWEIVSPESSLLDVPSIDGYIAQVWTGTARSLNTYLGRTGERTFEAAFLEYGVMQEMVRGTGRRMWFLHDPIEDNPQHTWEDYRKNYICTLVASLLLPDVSRYEIAPWPCRVMDAKYPQGNPAATGIGDDYATMLAVVMNQLRDMDQIAVAPKNQTEGVGVLLADSAMFQRADPALSAGTAADTKDPTRSTPEENDLLSGFFGMSMPLVKHGIPIRTVPLDNLIRKPGYLDNYKVLLLSYEFMKPLQPSIHQVLAEWVSKGGTLIYIGADTDPFREVREWWNQTSKPYAAPSDHLFEQLGLKRSLKQGEYRYKKGLVIVERKTPAWYSRSAEGADRLIQLVRRGVEAAGGKLHESNQLQIRRGPYVIAAVMDDSVGSEPLRLQGRFLDLLDAQLPIRNEVVLQPGQQAWLLDLDRVRAEAPVMQDCAKFRVSILRHGSSFGPTMLAAAGRIESWSPAKRSVRYTILSPQCVQVVSRILLPSAPKAVIVNGKRCRTYEWDASSCTALICHQGSAEGVNVKVKW